MHFMNKHSICIKYVDMFNFSFSDFCSLLSILLLVCFIITTGSVYNVTPHDHYYPNTTCYHCHNLQHYLLNATKYFTSNTQLLFLPGLHHLHTDLIIQNVHNISLIGSTTNGTTPDTVIWCNSSVGIATTNTTDLTVTNITVRNCLGTEHSNDTVLIKQCTNVQLRNVKIEENHNSYGIVGINVFGDSRFSYITSNAIIIRCDDSVVNTKYHHLSIDHYHVNDMHSNFSSILNFTFFQQFYKINVAFLNSSIQGLNFQGIIMSIFFKNKDHGQTTFIIKSCSFANNQIYKNLLHISTFNTQHGNAVWLEDSIINNHFSKDQKSVKLIEVDNGPDTHITNCSFQHNHVATIFQVIRTLFFLERNNITIANTIFLANTGELGKSFVNLDVAQLHLIGPVIFNNISQCKSIIKVRTGSIILYNYIEFSYVKVVSIFYQVVGLFPNVHFAAFIARNTVVYVTQSEFNVFASSKGTEGQYSNKQIQNPPCYFQYLSDTPLDGIHYNIMVNYSLVFRHNLEKSLLGSYKNLPLVHCRWLPQSAFKTSIPLEVNSEYIKYSNEDGEYVPLLKVAAAKKKLCSCGTNNSLDCYRAFLDPIYPGQTITMTISMQDHFAQPEGFTYSNNAIVTVLNATDWLPPTA